MTDKEALKLALDALNKLTDVFLDTEGSYGNYETNAIDQGYEAITALKERLADPMREVQRLGQEIEQDHTYGYASRLAVAIWQKHYMKDAPKWKPLDTTEGVLTQIDNMTCGLVKEKPAQPEQEPEIFCMHWEDRWGCNHYVDPKEPHPVDAKPLYTTPPQRTEEKNT